MTPKQQRFVEEYLIDLNATQAAIRAGYSEDTAHSIGHENLSKPEIASAIAERREKLALTAGVTQERIVAEYARMAFYDPAELMISDEVGEGLSGGDIVDGRLIHGLRGPADIVRLHENMRRAIVGWSWDKAGNFVVKLADKNTALTNLGRHLGMFTDKVEHSGAVAINVLPEDADL